MITATQIRVGQILKINNVLFRVLKVQHITPGKGNAVVQTELRNLKTKNKDNIRFRSAETVEQVEVSVQDVSFLYQEDTTYHFMNPTTFEQFEISQEVLEDVVQYLVPEGLLTISIYEGNPVSVSLPIKMKFEILECDPPSKGMAGASKVAKLVNDIEIKVPLFIKVGDVVFIETETGAYLEKA